MLLASEKLSGAILSRKFAYLTDLQGIEMVEFSFTLMMDGILLSIFGAAREKKVHCIISLA